MTNGEKLKSIFSNIDSLDAETGIMIVKWADNTTKFFKTSWWNAEYKEPTTKNDLGVDCISRTQTQTEIEMNASRYTIAKERGGMGQVEWSDQLIKVSDAVDIIRNLPSVTSQNQVQPPCEDCHTKMDEVRRAYDNAMKQEPILDKINKMKSEIADSLEFWDYSPNNNPLARDMLETITNFWGDVREVEE